MSDQQLQEAIGQDTAGYGPLLIGAGIGYAAGGVRGAVFGAVLGIVAANLLTAARVLSDPRIVQ